MHYTCIACTTIDSAWTIDKKIIHKFIQKIVNKYKLKVKKIQMFRFINTELKSDSESDLDSDLEKIEIKFITNQNLILITILDVCTDFLFAYF